MFVLSRLSLLLVPTLVSAAVAQGSYTVYGAGCAGTGVGLGTAHVTPLAYASKFGGSNNVIPFSGQVTRYQQLILGGELPAAFKMAGLGARRDERSAGVEGVLVDLEVSVGYTTRTPATMSTTFATNWDAGAPVNVFPRQLFRYPRMPNTLPTDPGEFILRIPWQTTFDWVPLAGRNLLVEVVQRGGSQPFTYALDACWSPSIRRLYAYADGAPVGSFGNVVDYGLPLCFWELTHAAVPILGSKEKPQIGNQMPVEMIQARTVAPALLLFGISDRAAMGLPLPFDLTRFGATGCTLLASNELAMPVTTTAAGTARFQFDVPLALRLIGARFYNQFVIVDPMANRLGIVTTNAAVGVVGQ